MGTAKIRPDSFTPRKFMNAMIQISTTAIEHAIRVDAWERRVERGDAGGCAHRDGEDVVGEERDACDLRGQHAEVVASDDVGATGAGVGLDGLAVREHQDHEQGDDPERQGHQRPERQESGAADQEDGEHLLGRVRDRGERVAGEHRQRGRVVEALVDLLVGTDLATEHHGHDVGPSRADTTRGCVGVRRRFTAVVGTGGRRTTHRRRARI